MVKSSCTLGDERGVMTEEETKWAYGARARHKEKHQDKVEEFVVGELDRLVSVRQCTKQQGSSELNLYAN